MIMTMGGILVNMEDALMKGSEIIKEQSRTRVMAWAMNHLERGIGCGMEYIDNKWHIVIDPRLPVLNINYFGSKSLDELTIDDVLPNEVGFCFSKTHVDTTETMTVLTCCYINENLDDNDPSSPWRVIVRPKFFNGQQITFNNCILTFL